MKYSIELTEWLAHGERGASSEAMVTHILGLKCGRSSYLDHPLDTSDFRRCRLLFNRVPEIRDALTKMAKASKVWEEIILNWFEICSLMDSEAPNWEEGRCSGPLWLTYNKIRECIKKGEEVRE